MLKSLMEVFYMNKIQKILEYAMRMERDAQEFYSFYCNKVSSPEIQKLFEELVEMEKSHFGYLKEWFDKLEMSEPPLALSWVVDNTSKEINTTIFADNSALISENEKELTDLSVIRLAYLMESDFELFYTNAANQVNDEESKKYLTILSKWEKEHKEMFKSKYEAMLNKQWGDLSGIILG